MLPTLKVRAVLFDMDGVLADSIAAVDRVWRAWSAEHGLDGDEVTRRAHGRPSLATIRDYLPQLSAAEQLAADGEIERREIAEVGGIVALPGALALLRALPADGWAVVTSCTRPLAVVRAQAAGLPQPPHFITASDITHGKPDPEPYLLGAQRLGCRPEECLVVEDVSAGVVAGKRAGARVLAMGTTESRERLLAAGADWYVRDSGHVRVTLAGGWIELMLDDSIPAGGAPVSAPEQNLLG